MYVKSGGWSPLRSYWLSILSGFGCLPLMLYPSYKYSISLVHLFMFSDKSLNRIILLAVSKSSYIR